MIPALEQGPSRTCDPAERGAHTEAQQGTYANVVSSWRMHLVEKTYTEAVNEELQPLRRTNKGEVYEGLNRLYVMNGTPCWSSGGTWGGRTSSDNKQ